jgi:surface antigen
MLVAIRTLQEERLVEQVCEIERLRAKKARAEFTLWWQAKGWKITKYALVQLYEMHDYVANHTAGSGTTERSMKSALEGSAKYLRSRGFTVKYAWDEGEPGHFLHTGTRIVVGLAITEATSLEDPFVALWRNVMDEIDQMHRRPPWYRGDDLGYAKLKALFEDVRRIQDSNPGIQAVYDLDPNDRRVLSEAAEEIYNSFPLQFQSIRWHGRTRVEGAAFAILRPRCRGKSSETST